MKPINVINEIEHTLREPVDRSKGQVKQITDLCDEIKNKTGKEISFNNLSANHYKLILDGAEYDFALYKDVIYALEMILKFI